MERESGNPRRQPGRPGFGNSGPLGPGPSRFGPSRAGAGRFGAARPGPSRPVGRRPAPPKGPATFAPSIPATRKQWRQMVKATIARLARELRIPTSRIAAETDLSLLVDADGLEPSGDARRLAAKLARLRQHEPPRAAVK